VPSAAQAQLSDLTFRHITRSNGLPVDDITALAQDRNGFIWIGTIEGIFRYDGYNFKKNTYADDNKNTLVNAVSKIYIDKHNKIWVGTIDAGITCIETNGTMVRNISSHNTSLATTTSDYVTDIKEDKKGNIWWTTVDGLFRLSADGKNIRCFKLQTTHPRGNLFSGLLIDKRGLIWVTGNLGLGNFDPAKEQFSVAGHTNEQREFFEHKKYFSAIAFQGSKLWYSTWAPDLGMYDLAANKSYTYYSGAGTAHPDFDQLATTLYTDKKGATWMATGKGLHMAKPGAVALSSTYQHNTENDFSIINNKVTAILEDREGNFWFGTKGGISITQPYKQQIQNLSVNRMRSVPFGGMEVSDIIEIDSSSLLIGTQLADGFFLTDRSFQVRKHISFHTSDFDWAWTHWNDPNGGRVFISTQEGMLFYDRKQKTLLKAKDTALQNFHPVSAFEATSDSILWMSRFWNKLLRYNLKTGEHKVFDLPLMGEKAQVLYLSRDRENRLWIIGHGTGLMRWDEKQEKIVERLIANHTTQSLRQTEIYFFKDIGDHYLIGYYTKGISLYQKKTKKYEHFTTYQGLISNLVRAAVIDKDGTVWIATKNGISHFFPATKTFKNYSYDNGILHNDFVTIAQLSDGRIVGGSTKGLVAFHPAQIQDEPMLKPPFITDINIYGTSLQTDSFIHLKKPLHISYRQNYFSFEYISLLYNKTKSIEYAYMLEGIDKEWHMAGNRRFASYSNIPGGNYRFRLKARVSGGPWIESRDTIAVWVSAPFYSKWWFYLLCAIVIVLVVYAIFQYRFAQILKLERMRTAISSDLHDEVGASLTSISLFSEMVRQPGAATEKKEEYLQRIGQSSRDSIEKMSDIIWSINPDNDSLQQMLVRMKNYATEVAEATDITVNWSQSGDLSSAHLSMEDRKNVYLFFKEAVNNAVKHSTAQNLCMHLATTAHRITMAIKDDGKGFDPAGTTTGNGMKNMQRRAALLRGNVTIQSTPGDGTAISLQFSSAGH